MNLPGTEAIPLVWEEKRASVVKNLARPRNVALAAFGLLAALLAISTPSQAAGDHGVGGGHGAAGGARHGFEGHHFEEHHFEGHHLEGHHFEGHHFEGDGRFGFGLGVPYFPPYYAAPRYWYYCPSFNEYYPNVTSCPEAWVPVPAS